MNYLYQPFVPTGQGVFLMLFLGYQRFVPTGNLGFKIVILSKSKKLRGASVKIVRLTILFILLVGSACRFQKKAPIVNPLPKIDPFRSLVPDSLKYLLPILDTVFALDQKYRTDYSRISFYKDSIQKIDTSNLEIVTKIIDQYGILGFKDIGMTGNFALTLTIQHADLATQRKYLPAFREALSEKKILPSTYAMLEDRVNTRSGCMQRFGTQVMLIKGKVDVMPIYDVDNLTKRRDSIGMKESFEFYVRRFGGEFDLSDYKQLLPELMKKYNISCIPKF